MHIPKDHIIIGIVSLTLVCLVTGGFLILYVMNYNNRKKRHLQEREWMKRAFDEELLKSQLEVQEHTLKTIAAEIHDNVGQMLSLTKITLGSIPDTLQPQAIVHKVRNAYQLVDQSIKDLRNLAYIFHADNLLAHGLQSAVETELSWLAKIENLEIRSSVTGSSMGEIGPRRELIAFRLLQEVLNNAIKHASATSIRVSFEYNASGVLIVVHDNGKGFNVEEKCSQRAGMGIGNFYRRADMIKGDFQLQSDPKHGTTASLFIPYNDQNGTQDYHSLG